MKMVAEELQNGMLPRKKIVNGISKPKNGRLNGSTLKTEDWRYSYWESFEETPLLAAILTYICLAILVIIGHVRDLLQSLGITNINTSTEPKLPGFVPLYNNWESFYTRHIYRRASHCVCFPVGNCPGATVGVLQRETDDYGWNFTVTDRMKEVLNFGSYNYLGFSETHGTCADAVLETTEKYGLNACGSRQELGFLDIHRELEELIADYLGVEAAITIPMGFATNSMNMPCLVRKGCLIISDELNHASLVLGSRLTGATIRTFKHNDMESLEQQLREAVVYGQPRSHKEWKKILIVAEGVYSMEGSIVMLPEVIRLKKKYKAYLYLDEAHSIGAMGPHGRGVVDYFGADPKDVDILMGTFTKSFGSAGGYIAGSRKLINHLRVNSHASVYSTMMPAVCAQQIISTMRIIMGLDCKGEGRRRIQQLKWNLRYFRRQLHEMGFVIYGNKDSPVVPMLLFMPTQLVAFSEMCMERGLGTVVAAFPATPITKTRARFCLSAAHDKEMIDRALKILKEVGTLLHLTQSTLKVPIFSENEIELA